MNVKDSKVFTDEREAGGIEAREYGRTYNAHEVAEIIAELFGDACACNFNGISEWLTEKCELLDACPDPGGAACWEQYLKYRDRRGDNGK